MRLIYRFIPILLYRQFTQTENKQYQYQYCNTVIFKFFKAKLFRAHLASRPFVDPSIPKNQYTGTIAVLNGLTER